MKGSFRRTLVAAPPILVGLALVALSMTWSILHAKPAFMVVDGLTFSLGNVPRGGFQRHSWVIRNGGLLPLKLRTKFTSGRSGFSLWIGEDYVIPAGRLLTVSLCCPIPSREGTPFTASAEVATGDPERPRVRFHVYGISGPPEAR